VGAESQTRPEEVKLATQDLRIGVFVCDCGSNIAGAVDTEVVREYAAALPNVIVAVRNKYTCADPGQQQIQRTIREHKLNRVVVASCSPSSYEPIFRQCIEGAGLNRYLLEMANIREHCSWVTPNDREAATRKAKDIVNVAVARSRWLYPQEEEQISVTDAALVVGGGVAGMQTALDLADAGHQVYLVEKKPSIGGIMAQLDKVYPDIECSI
jgi:heterodisulfide reductase subunit A